MTQSQNKTRPTSGVAIVQPIEGEPVFQSLSVKVGDDYSIRMTDLCHVHATPTDRANAKLIANAFNSATACYSLGYDGTKCVENVAEIIKALSDVERHLTFGINPLQDVEILRDLLSNLKN